MSHVQTCRWSSALLTSIALFVGACGGGSKGASQSAPPGAPTGVTATAGNAQATVTWTAPASHGGSAITGYTVVANPGGATATTTGATTATATGLTNGTAYTFTVSASNAAGNGPASDPSNPVTPSASAGPALAVAPSSLSFSGAAGGAKAAAQTLTVTNAGAGALALPSVTVTYASGTAWLSTVVTGAAAPYSISVQANPSVLAAGSYTASLSVSADGAGSQAIAVTFTVAPAATTSSIGPDGGTVTYQGATLVIPAGALAQAQPISIGYATDAVPAGYTGYSPVFQFLPAGLTFLKPVSVSLPFTGSAQLATLFWSYPSAAGYERIGGLPTGGVVTASVTHFSTGFVADGVNFVPAPDTSCIQTLAVAGRYSGQGQAGTQPGQPGCVANCYADGGCTNSCPKGVYPVTGSDGDGGTSNLNSAVAVFFNVQDCQGRPVTGLDAGSFTVLEDNSPVSVEAEAQVLPTNGVTFFVQLVLDVSSHTNSLRAAMFEGAKAFVSQVQTQGKLPVAIGIETLAGEQQITEQLAPTLDTKALLDKLTALGTFVDPDINSTNLHGGVIQSLAHLNSVEDAYELRNYGGALTKGFAVVFTDGLDTAGYNTLSDAVQAEQADFRNRVFAVALRDSADYNQAALDSLTYNRQTLINSQDATTLSRDFSALATLIAGQIHSFYLLGYCSPKRANVNTVTLRLAGSAVNQAAASFYFDARGFGPGCSAAKFQNVCDGYQCGGLGCGSCDDRTSTCTGPGGMAVSISGQSVAFKANQCTSDCFSSTKVACGATSITNAQGYQQTCNDSEVATACNGQCFDLVLDSSHCGACATNCATTVGTGATCQSGVCGCPGTEPLCGGVCVADASTNATHCGASRACAVALGCS
jgi:hypothetical protein